MKEGNPDMNIRITPAPLCGSLRAISSKSYMHRALICASLADLPTVLICPESNQDIRATAGCLCALGADIKEENGRYTVTPISKDTSATADLMCDESGSTLRFMLPVTAALGKSAVFHARGRLSERPLSPLYEALTSHGAVLSANGTFPLSLSGKLQCGEFHLDGGISSQFFTGLLLALPIPGGNSKIFVDGKLESAPYVRLTEAVMNRFGVFPVVSETFMEVYPQKFRSPGTLEIEGDWSNAAFWLVAGAISGDIRLSGLQKSSAQGDKEIITLLRRMGADITEDGGSVIAKKSKLHGITVCAEDIPDLVPILAVAAACAEGETVISGASRLRLKESDRIESVLEMLKALGAVCRETADGMIIRGGSLQGGIADACNDHRIAMSAAVAASVCSSPVTILGAEAVKKSYPAFFDDLKKLGGVTECIT